MTTPALSIDKALALYIKLRDQRDQLEAEHKERLAPLRAQMDQIEQALHIIMKQQGSDKVSAKGIGTAYVSEVLSLKAADKQAVWDYVLENDMPELLQWSVNRTAYREHEETHGPVPGVEVSRALKVNIRRA